MKRPYLAAICATLALLLPAACDRNEPVRVVEVAPGAEPIAKLAMISIHVQADGSVLWNGEKVTREELTRRLKLAAASIPQPQVTFGADRNANYGDLGSVMKEAESAGLKNMGVIGGI